MTDVLITLAIFFPLVCFLCAAWHQAGKKAEALRWRQKAETNETFKVSNDKLYVVLTEADYRRLRTTTTTWFCDLCDTETKTREGWTHTRLFGPDQDFCPDCIKKMGSLAAGKIL